MRLKAEDLLSALQDPIGEVAPMTTSCLKLKKASPPHTESVGRRSSRRGPVFLGWAYPHVYIVTVADCAYRPSRTRDLCCQARTLPVHQRGNLVGKASTYTACSTSLCYIYAAETSKFVTHAFIVFAPRTQKLSQQPLRPSAARPLCQLMAISRPVASLLGRGVIFVKN